MVLHRGLPHAPPNYSAREDIWTRAWPFLLFVMFVELFTTFGDRYDGWSQFGVFVGGHGVIVGAFVLVPAFMPWWLNSHRWRESVAIIGFTWSCWPVVVN